MELSRVSGAPGGVLRPSWPSSATWLRKSRFLDPPGLPSWGPSWGPKFDFMLKNHLKMAPEGFGRRFWCVLKIGFNIEGSWDGFLIDFDTVLGAPEGSKMWFSLRRGTNFAIFAYLNISYLLDPSKYRFWVDLGSQVGHQNRTCWPKRGICGV